MQESILQNDVDMHVAVQLFNLRLDVSTGHGLLVVPQHVAEHGVVAVKLVQSRNVGR